MTEVEQAMREMLRECATDIGTAPDWLDDFDAVARRRAAGQVRNVRRHKALLVAAVIALVAAISLGIAHLVHRRPPPPAHPTTIPTQQRSYCPATLPRSWPRTGNVVVPSAERPSFLAGTPDGRAIVGRYDGKTRDVAVVRRASVRVLFTIDRPRVEEAVAAAVEGDWAAITIGHDVTSNFLPVELDLVNLRTGERHVITRLSAADIRAHTNAVIGAAIVGGRVYWGVGTMPSAIVHQVQVYNIATGQIFTDPRSTAPGDGVTSGLVESAYAVTYQTQHGSVTMPRQLPPAITAAMRHAGKLARSTLVTDGSAYAWFRTPGQIAWWQPGQHAVSVFREPYSAAPDSLLVAGSYLIYGATDGATIVTDARTGASAPTPDNDLVYRGAGGGVLWSEIPHSRLLRVDTVTRLPQLHCS